MDHNIAKILLEAKAITVRVHPHFTWTSGLKSPIYTDNRVLISYPAHRSKVLTAFFELIEKNNLSFDAIAATATAGISWGAWIAQEMNKPLVYVRSSAKSHGKQNVVEGIVEKGETYLVVEDLISTGKSSSHAAAAVRQAGGTVTDVIAIFSYEFHSAQKQFESHELLFHVLSNFSSLLETAVAEKYISDSDKELILKWKEKPEAWSP